MKELLWFIRPLNCFMAGIAVVVSFILAEFYSTALWLYAFFSVFFICAGGMVINDFFDVEIDRINNPEKWKKMKKYKKRTFLIFSLLLFSLGLVFSAFLGIYPLIFAFTSVLLLIFYPWKLKKRAFLKNAVVAYLVASVFIYGAIISLNPLPVIFSLLAFFSNLGREIIKDIIDIEGDKKAGIVTLPMIIGEMNAKLLFIFFTVSAIILSPLPYALGILGKSYLIFLLPSIVGFAYSCFLSFFNEKNASKWSKISMLLALFAFLGGKFL